MFTPRYLLLWVVTACLLPLLVLPVQAAIRDPLDRPNFVLFFVDDLGYGDCGFTGNPTTSTPSIDKLAWNGKILTTWYSGCSVCSCSRAALMTGRQYPRTGAREVYVATSPDGLPLEEVTIAEQLKKANYSSAIVGKWHLGQRPVYLPCNHGFDYYLGVPYSVDHGNARTTTCPSESEADTAHAEQQKAQMGGIPEPPLDGDYASWYLPLVYQEHNKTQILEQPLDFSTLAMKYNHFATKFIEEKKDEPFLLYFPFSHVHTTTGVNPQWDNMPNLQYSSCQFRNTSNRGAFGDALAEVDWMVGNVYQTLQRLGLEENTLIVFTSDNGPWNSQGYDGGSYGVFNGQFAGYPWTGKASTWEGGIREPAFAYWKGQIDPFSRSSETISSMDVFLTFSKLAGIPLPPSVVYDGRDMSDILLRENGKSNHDFLFIYGWCDGHWPKRGIAAVRHGPYKAHFTTSPGLGGDRLACTYYKKYPLLFNVEKDPSESRPICTGDELPNDREASAAIMRIMRAYAMEKATFEYGDPTPLPDGPGEGPHHYGLCCNRATNCSCTKSLWDEEFKQGLFHIGTKAHHDHYHDILGETNHMDNYRL